MAHVSCPCALVAVVDFILDGVFESDELAKMLDFSYLLQVLDVHSLHCYHVVFWDFDVVLEMIHVVVVRW